MADHSSPRPQVFISYSRKDREWLDRLQVHLRPLEREHKIERWDDTKIQAGDVWREEIRKALESAQVAVLLVSANFLASDFIANNELPPLLAAAKDRGGSILPVILSPCRFARTKSLVRFQAVNPELKPLSGMSWHEQEELLVQVEKAIEDALTRSAPESETPVTENPVTEPPETPKPKPAMPRIQNIHGWSAKRVQELQRQTAEALGLTVGFQEQLRDGSEGPEMVVIPAGEFLMGSPEDEEGRDDDERQHRVVIEQPFALGKYAVTVGEFQRFTQASGYKTEAEKGDESYYWDNQSEEWKKDPSINWRNPGFEQVPAQPVVCASWNDAVAYVEWLSEKMGKQYRLPTEAEWEYGARAGTKTAYHFGNTIDAKQANYEFKHGKTLPVGQFPANAWGLHDVHGNVWEWTCSEYDKGYGGAEQQCVSNNHASALRVLRGGSWGNSPRGVRAADRGRTPPGNRDGYSGFRLARKL